MGNPDRWPKKKEEWKGSASIKNPDDDRGVRGEKPRGRGREKRK